jgi:hypothetical protein
VPGGSATIGRDAEDDVRRAAIALIAANVVIAAVGMPLGELLHDKPDHFFREQAAGTYWSGLQLLSVALTAARVALAARTAPRGSPIAASAGFFAFAAAGFAFLAVDEVARLHEQLEDVLVAHEGPGPKPPLLDRIDDLIVLGYGVLGAAVLIRARAALVPFGTALPWLAGAGACFLVMVTTDLLTTRDDVMYAIVRGRPWVRPVWHWLPAVEEAAKLLAEACFVAAAGTCLVRARAGAPTSRTG